MGWWLGKSMNERREERAEQYRLVCIESKLDELICNFNRRMEKVMSALDDLTAAVAAEDTVIDSVLTLLDGIATELKNLPNQDAALVALTADVNAKRDKIAAAIVANTPTPPSPPADTTTGGGGTDTVAAGDGG